MPLDVQSTSEESRDSSTPLRILLLGRTSYRDTWALQKELQRNLIEKRGQPTLILCEHDPVITLGRSAKKGNILVPASLLEEQGVEAIEIERGGDVTYHGPGQLVGYPILDLSEKRKDVGWYMRSLEEVILRTLRDLSIPARRFPGRTGVWTEHTANDSFFAGYKIASIGVRISRWCTLHGFALNVVDMSPGFSLINPCGFTDTTATSVSEELARLALQSPQDLFRRTESLVTKHFLEVFGYRPVSEHSVSE